MIVMDFNAALHALSKAQHAVTVRAHRGENGLFETTTSCRTDNTVRYRCYVKVERNGRKIGDRKLWAVVSPAHRTSLSLNRTGYVKVGSQSLHVTKRG